MRTPTRVWIACTALLGLVLPAVPAAPSALADDPVVVAGYDFEDGSTQGWFGRGSAVVAATADAANTGGFGLRTTGRTASWNGPSVELAPVLLTGATYAITVHTRLIAGTAAATLQLTVQRQPVGGSTAFDFVANGAVTDAGWTQLRGSYTVPTESSQLQLYVETADATAAYDVDDVMVTMTAPPPGGPPDEAPIVSDFEDGTAQGFVPRIGPEVLTVTTADAHTGTHSLLTTGRSDFFYGPARNLLGRVTKGKKYEFSVWVKLAPGEPVSDLRLSIERRSGASQSFENVAGVAGVTPDAWVRIAGSYVLGSDVDFLAAYVETASGTASFYIDDFERTFVRPRPIERDIPSLKDVFADDFKIGTAMLPSDTFGVHAELVDKHFSSMTAGNAMKWDATEPVEGQFTFTDGDVLADFAAAHGIALRGHTLVWHSQIPAWVFQRDGVDLTDSPEDKALLLRRIENHIRAVAGHYADQIYAWDVVNEVVDEVEPDGLRRNRFYEIAGLDYIRTAFRVAREVAPRAKLYLNDFNSEYPAKRAKIFNLVRQLRAEGVPVDGIGHQLHINIERQRIGEIEKSITEFAKLGVEQQVTELDMSAYTNFVESLPAIPADNIAIQGYRYRDVFDLFRRHRDKINSVTVWGVADDNTWLKNFPFPRLDLPLLFDEQLQSKPAYWGLVDPARLPQITRRLTVPAGRPQLDGQRELEWNLLPGTDIHSRSGVGANFQVRWDAQNLYVEAEVIDPTRDHGDLVDLFVDQNNGKTPAYEPDDARYRVLRNGGHGPGFRAATRPTALGYRLEAAIPLRPSGTLDRSVGFDIRVRDASNPTAPVSWNDNSHGQETDTSRWATLTLVKPIGQVDVPRGTPVVDGGADPVWTKARTVATDVQVIGTGGARATAKLLWDAGHLYVLATVTDPTLDESSPNTFEQDSVEIFLSPENHKDTGYRDEDGQYRISFTNRATITGNFGGFRISDNLTSATRVVPGGYVVEAAIELDSIQAGLGSLLGFDLQVNDATAGARTAARTWHDPTGRSFVDTSRWGVAKLTR
ncbi:MAG TPA: endo-1,4-beta-xylanase [Actinophytocola sp.]|uniref:endo-1,4-beta-xylanase n=1 Tax=Actinophytocola sp. TaxID=1872138 RepID=UPI002DDCC118|nr:endo-1,4-beta-xylanase [Actinophytocola sp.]HEV2779989.1 endo-1,4-beta-xylanase [Actinophytocola sp.]